MQYNNASGHANVMTSGQLSLIASCARECARPIDDHDAAPTISDEMAVYDMISKYTHHTFNASQLAHINVVAQQCNEAHSGAMSVFEGVRDSVTIVEQPDEDFVQLI
jgi:UDP-glucose 6-dehydrogenase